MELHVGSTVVVHQVLVVGLLHFYTFAQEMNREDQTSTAIRIQAHSTSNHHTAIAFVWFLIDQYCTNNIPPPEHIVYVNKGIVLSFLHNEKLLICPNDVFELQK